MTPCNTDQVVYILGDVDRVREHIDRQLLVSNLEGVKIFSTRLTDGLLKLARQSERLLRAETIMAGGDDVLFCVQIESYSQELLSQISKTFQDQTGCTISFGVGTTIPVAYLNLRKAKAEGGGRICSSEAQL